MSQALRKLTSIVSKTNCIVIFINQLREKIGVMFGNPETTTGGRALKFYASVRLDVRRTEALKQSGEVVGNHTRVKVVKNKIAPPFKEAEFDIDIRKGNLHRRRYSGLARNVGSLPRAALVCYNEQRADGRENAKQFLHDNPEIRDEVEMRVREHYGLPVPEAFRKAKTEQQEEAWSSQLRKAKIKALKILERRSDGSPASGKASAGRVFSGTGGGSSCLCEKLWLYR